MDIDKLIEESIKISLDSFTAGAFPAGALIVKDREIFASSISGIYPKINHHAESSAIDQAMDKLNIQLTECLLVSSMEPCLMCLSKAYWAGIRKFYFAIKKENTNHRHYESTLNHTKLIQKFNEPMEMNHISKFETSALEIVKQWEKINM